MIPARLLGTIAILALTGTAAAAQTLDEVRARGALHCGVSSGLAGFSAPDASGVWQGFDVALCRAVAAAVLGDPGAVRFVPTTLQNRFDTLASGEADLLARHATWSLTRDIDDAITLAAVTYHDAQGFMVPRAAEVGTAAELDNATICVLDGSSAAANLADQFRLKEKTFQPRPAATIAEGQRSYLAGDCDAIAADISTLAALRASLAEPEAHVLLPETFAKGPMGPMLRSDDPAWTAVVRWTLHALIAAEEYGVTSANIAELAQGTRNPEVNRLLGSEGELGAALGLDPDWAVRAISAGGNYGEIYAANIGEQTPIGLPRGLNALWTQGGLMYAPPFR